MKATSLNDPTAMRAGVVLFLVLALVLCSKDLFAQRNDQRTSAKKARSPNAGKQVTVQPSLSYANGSGSLGGGGNYGLFPYRAYSGPVSLGPDSICVPLAAMDSMLWGEAWNIDPPASVVLGVQGPWVFGALLNSEWPASHSNQANVLSTAIQPFIHYDLSAGWYFNTVPTFTGEMCYAKHLILPLGPSVGKVHYFGDMPVDLQVGAYYNAEKQQESPGWQLNFQIRFPFPQ